MFTSKERLIALKVHSGGSPVCRDWEHSDLRTVTVFPAMLESLSSRERTIGCHHV